MQKINTVKLHDAIIFAAKAHKGQVRKGTDIDYITHPMEVLQILTRMDADENLLIAGVLHDVAEDTDVTVEEIRKRFGDDVALLVEHHTEDKTLSWRERKERAVADLEYADKRTQMLVMADKVSNQYSIYADLQECGEELWSRFNAPKNQQSWYYSAVQDALKEMQNYDDTADVYWEMVSTYKDIFVTFWADEAFSCIYQTADAGTYVINREEPVWLDYEGDLPEGLIKITRQQSEQMEAQWLSEYIIHIGKRDMADGLYDIYDEEGAANSRKLSIAVSGMKIQFNCYDSAIYVDENGLPRESRFYYALEKKESAVFAKMLRTRYGAGRSFGELLKDAFGQHDGPLKFKAFCEALNLGYTFCTDRRPRENRRENG